MGGGSWTARAFCSYSTSRGRDVDNYGRVLTSYTSAQEMYTQRRIHERMDPKKFQVRECLDSADHPNTVPVILAIDVTGSMGSAAMEVAKSLNSIVTDITKTAKDAEFCIMAIGDTYCDNAPVQMSQFESDVRIAQAFDDIWFEAGGGSNAWESYTAAWYMALNRTRLDAWKRGSKGVLITLGDEPINPRLDKAELKKAIGGDIVDPLETQALYHGVSEKYDVYHICVQHGSEGLFCLSGDASKPFSEVIGKDHVFTCKVNELPHIVPKIVTEHAFSKGEAPSSTKVDANGDIDW